MLRKKLRRHQVLAFFGQVPAGVVSMEACGGAHFWGREIGKLGREVRLIPPAYVKPFVNGQRMMRPMPKRIARQRNDRRCALSPRKAKRRKGQRWSFGFGNF